MELPRYRTSRQKVCRQCSSAKARCDRGSIGSPCTRCGKRGIACSHGSGSVIPGPSRDPAPSTDDDDKPAASAISPDVAGIMTTPTDSRATTEGLTTAVVHSMIVRGSTLPTAAAPEPAHAESDRLDFSQLDLICSIDAEGIRNRFINPYVPAAGQTAKVYDPTVTPLIHRMLRSYASISVHDRGLPPFVHPFQLRDGLEQSPLQTCLNIVRLFERPMGAQNAANDLLRREMDRIYDHRYEYTTIVGLAAFQAYLIYCLVQFSWVNENPSSSMVQSMMQLQELAGDIAREGVMCAAEQQTTRPRWEAWIVAEAKRRAIYVMYLFDGLLSARDGVPSFLGLELVGLSAPACQSLWSASTRQGWEREYNTFLAQWPEGYLTIDELWPTPPDLGEAGIARRQTRVEHWLEDVDKFGTMMFAATTYIHKN